MPASRRNGSRKTAAPVECVNIGAEDLPKLLAFAQEKKIDLTVVGPDNPLALGIVDLFQKHGLRIWGVNQKAAQFESSKVFSQKFMEKYGIPTAAAGTFDDVAAAKRFCATLGGKCVVKADGLALGKGVLICATQAEAERAQCLHATDAGHIHIQQNSVVGCAAQQLQRLFSARGFGHLKAEFGQRRTQCPADGRFIVNNENANCGLADHFLPFCIESGMAAKNLVPSSSSLVTQTYPL